MSRLVAIVLCLALVAATRAPEQPRRIMDHAPAWSPDGRWIAFNSNREGKDEIFLVRPDGRDLHRVTRTNDPAIAPKWSHDGERIHFHATVAGTRHDFSVLVDGSDLRPEPSARGTSVSRSGIVLFDSAANIFARDRGGVVKQLTHVAHAEQASFSPNDSLIVFEEWPRDELPYINIMRADGGGVRRIAHGTDPSWSPDGAVILFKTDQQNARPIDRTIATIRPDGSDLRRYGVGVLMSFSPDGTHIVYMAPGDGDNARVWIMHRDGTDARCVTCPEASSRR